MNHWQKIAWLLCLLGTAACSGGAGGREADVLFFDGFAAGQTGNWLIEGDNLGQAAIIDEQLIIELAGNNMMQFTTLPDHTFDNFVLEVDARLLQGDLGSSFGILFRMQDATRFYRFEITGDGLYMVERRDGDAGWTRFVETWTESPAINQGLNSTNRLKVVAVDQSMTLYVNEILVHQFNDTAYSSGTIALDVGTFIQPQAQVAFDNVVVRRP